MQPKNETFGFIIYDAKSFSFIPKQATKNQLKPVHYTILDNKYQLGYWKLYLYLTDQIV